MIEKWELRKVANRLKKIGKYRSEDDLFLLFKGLADESGWTVEEIKELFMENLDKPKKKANNPNGVGGFAGKWNNLPTATLRLPERFHGILLKAGKLLDQGILAEEDLDAFLERKISNRKMLAQVTPDILSPVTELERKRIEKASKKGRKA